MHGSYNTVEQPLQRTEAKIVKVEFYHYPPLKSFNMKVNNDHYRHTNAERLHQQQTLYIQDPKYTRNAKGILQEEHHQMEIWMYAQEGRKREMVSVWGK